jgi:hypothetical protein
MTIYYCTVPQLAHEIFRSGNGGTVAATLVLDSSSPYRARGLPKYRISIELSWLYDCQLLLIDTRGRVRVLNWADAGAVLGSCVSGPVSLSITVPDASSIAPPNTPAREALLVAKWVASAKTASAGAAEAIRGEWQGRMTSARRSGHLAAAEAIDGAVAFDCLRGA